ncbi:MAG TPA: RpoL/Rpb11 RNA polymerase subunit family protein [Candidatus Acidoferrum sp.]|nr:RpoL/Rpb11 RNA polymerase subunit family protein [Candidatus Acidoferrum sp.]
MEVKILKNESKELIIEFESRDLTMPDLLAHELLNDGDVSFAGVSRSHPETGKPILTVKTSKKGASDALSGAIKRINENVKDMKGALSKKK